MQRFNIGELIIDTKIKRAARVIAYVPYGKNALFDLYILMIEDDENRMFYISDEEDLIVYDKYYWDEEINGKSVGL